MTKRIVRRTSCCRRFSLFAAWIAVILPAFGQSNAAQSETKAAPYFVVATIKPSDLNAHSKAGQAGGRLFVMQTASLSMLISFAYGLQLKQIVNAPDWVHMDKYDVTALPSTEGQPTLVQMRGMMQKLLAERFNLTFHTEKRELSVYALGIGKNGPKLAKNVTDSNKLPSLLFGKLGHLVAHNASMGDLASLMQEAVLDRPVVDQTGITGRYDFTLDWTPDESQFGSIGIRIPPPADNVNAPPGLFTAIQQEIGLKLNPVKAPTDVLVVEHVERPSAN